MNAIELGFDIFTGSYPYLLSQRGQALVFDYELSDEEELNETHVNKYTEEKDDDQEDEEANAPGKRRKIQEDDVPAKRIKIEQNKYKILIDLNDKKFNLKEN